MDEPQRDARQRHLWVAPLILLALAAASFVAYNTATSTAADEYIYVYALSLLVGPACVWLWMRNRDASMLQALLGCLLVPVAWVLKECVAVGQFFSPAEALYYAFNPLVVGLFAAVALQVAVGEVLLRRVRTGRWQILGGPGLVIGVILLLAATYAVTARTYGVTAAYYAYIAGYRALFGN